MTKKRSLVALVAAKSWLVAGCTTSRQYSDSIVAQLGDPSRRAAAIVDCSERLKLTISPEQREAASAIMRVKPSRVPWTFCDRLGSAVARGDMSADEFADAMSGWPGDATLARMLRALAPPGFSEPQQQQEPATVAPGASVITS